MIPDDKTPSLCYDEIKAVFNSELCFNDQLQAFIKAVTISDDEVNQRYQPICEMLESLFKTTLSKSKCHMFGSIITGLGFKNSDLDVYLNTGIISVLCTFCIKQIEV